MAAGHGKTNFFSFQWNHLLSNNLFYDLKLSSTENYSGGYLYKDPLDSNYVHDKYLESFGPGFYTGGQQKHHDERTVNSFNAKFDVNWIVNKSIYEPSDSRRFQGSRSVFLLVPPAGGGQPPPRFRRPKAPQMV